MREEEGNDDLDGHCMITWIERIGVSKAIS